MNVWELLCIISMVVAISATIAYITVHEVMKVQQAADAARVTELRGNMYAAARDAARHSGPIHLRNEGGRMVASVRHEERSVVGEVTGPRTSVETDSKGFEEDCKRDNIAIRRPKSRKDG